jgi:hypothetical protein
LRKLCIKVSYFLNSNHIFAGEKCRFRKGFSTGKTWYKFLDEMLCALQNKMVEYDDDI